MDRNKVSDSWRQNRSQLCGLRKGLKEQGEDGTLPVCTTLSSVVRTELMDAELCYNEGENMSECRAFLLQFLLQW